MSTTTTVTVHCDVCSWWADPVSHAQTATDARRDARSVGYVRRRVLGVQTDLCPHCALLTDAEIARANQQVETVPVVGE